jgi:hypothetical protein
MEYRNKRFSGAYLFPDKNVKAKMQKKIPDQ